MCKRVSGNSLYWEYVIWPSKGNPYNGHMNHHNWVDDKPPPRGTTRSFDPSTYLVDHMNHNYNDIYIYIYIDTYTLPCDPKTQRKTTGLFIHMQRPQVSSRISSSWKLEQQRSSTPLHLWFLLLIPILLVLFMPTFRCTVMDKSILSFFWENANLNKQTLATINTIVVNHDDHNDIPNPPWPNLEKR